ncbi:nuclear pore complex subunit nup85 [Colletotrichum truncatum]|uniref:Nuclear pore complex subunit nup85 n=1 Tax=Colletotrichum truncatum TaxID=5467 RepID=A0ACC3ZFU0_COLTU|nr:nuclear pore complex subunit nup85 [Colletotrichum truncatum]KAF6801685.1 nuclear pore complex subunit nup85 [Colletotrichum truncatum]
MPNKFSFDDLMSSSPPSTPGQTPQKGSSYPFGDNPSTTPAGPPPSSAASFTPAGAPSASYLGSSLLGGTTDQKPFSFGGASTTGSSRNLFGRSDTTSQQPLGRSIQQSGKHARQPSGLSKEYDAGEREVAHDNRTGRYMIPDDSEEDDEDEDEYDEREVVDAEMERYLEADMDEDDVDAEADEEELADDDDDMFLNMRHSTRQEDEFTYSDDGGDGIDGAEESDLLLLATPAATERIRREAEDIFRASSMRRSSTNRRSEFRYASIAKDLYNQMGMTVITESPELVLKTEDLVNQLYDEGIGAQEDPEKLDVSLSTIVYPLVELWDDFSETLPLPEGEHVAEIGPGPDAEPFHKAAYVARLVLQMHHTRFAEGSGEIKAPPLPEVLFNWIEDNHNLSPDQFDRVMRHRPSPASHSLFWPTLRSALIRGNVNLASQLLRNAGWEAVRKGTRAELAYTGKALENLQRAVGITCEALDMCPANKKNWDIFSSDWTLYRIQAKGSLDKLQRFAEGKDKGLYGGDSHDSSYGQPSLARLARKAEGQVPWDIYEHLQTIYQIIMGTPDAIMETAQDWCEATIGLFGWWEEGRGQQKSLRMSRSQGLRRPDVSSGPESYFERLSLAFHTAIESEFHFNAMNPVEVAIASAFESNFAAVIGILRAWSLPIASSVAELASLGQWLPKPEAANLFTMDSLDMEDLDILGVAPQSADEVEGIKDTTLTHYARELAGIDQLSDTRSGWEMAIQVLGRMDSAAKSEEMVGELLGDILQTLDSDSGATVDKVWRILNDLGMINYAEQTAETYAELLAEGSHRYGEALWYYALAHRPSKVREVLNLLMSYSLLHSTVYPPANDLDDHLYRLLNERSTTLEQYAKQDLEAAQLLGRILSGYATLRKYYEIRDTDGLADMSSHKSASLRRQAASALVAVIASSDDNIRGGLYDETRDAVVSEDFILALLGEALPFINQNPCIITLDQMDVMLKAIEDIQTVNSTIFNAADEFFKLVLASAQGLKGSTPADLMRKSTGSLSGSSYMLSGSSMLASQLNRSISGSGGLSRANTKRGWDWRTGLTASASAEDILRILRLGLSRDLATLWLADADNTPLY